MKFIVIKIKKFIVIVIKKIFLYGLNMSISYLSVFTLHTYYYNLSYLAQKLKYKNMRLKRQLNSDAK